MLYALHYKVLKRLTLGLGHPNCNMHLSIMIKQHTDIINQNQNPVRLRFVANKTSPVIRQSTLICLMYTTVLFKAVSAVDAATSASTLKVLLL